MIRTWCCTIRSEEAQFNRIQNFIPFHNNRHPQNLGANGVPSSISYLANEGQVSASSCSKALDAIHSGKKVLKKDIELPPARTILLKTLDLRRTSVL